MNYTVINSRHRVESWMASGSSIFVTLTLVSPCYTALINSFHFSEFIFLAWKGRGSVTCLRCTLFWESIKLLIVSSFTLRLQNRIRNWGTEGKIPLLCHHTESPNRLGIVSCTAWGVWGVCEERWAWVQVYPRSQKTAQVLFYFIIAWNLFRYLLRWPESLEKTKTNHWWWWIIKRILMKTLLFHFNLSPCFGWLKVVLVTVKKEVWFSFFSF